MFCPQCGCENNNESKFCVSCGSLLNNSLSLQQKPPYNNQQPNYQYFNNQQSNCTPNNSQQKNNLPQCTYCGYVGNWKKDSVLRPIDYIIGICLLIFGVIPGLIYLGVVFTIRSTNDSTRDKICPKCGAKNMWTFLH